MHNIVIHESPGDKPIAAKSSKLLGARIDSIDILRGLIILIMMLDHVRERFFMHTPTGDPIYDTVSPELYFTRYITHFCAPIFIFLAGMSAWLYANPANGQFRSPSSFLFKRGVVLVLFDIVLYNALWIELGYNTIWLQVLWAIGLSMIGLSLVCKMNIWLIGALGLLITFGHDAIKPSDIVPGDFAFTFLTILFQNNFIGEIAGIKIKASYPVLAWFGVILVGYCAGQLYAKNVAENKRKKTLLAMGIICLLVMLVLRGFNLYGEVMPWSVQETMLASVMSFLNFSKYPPTLNYVLITVGVGCLLLFLFEQFKDKAAKPFGALKVFGSVPMFAYFAHLYILLVAYWILFAIFGPTHGERFALGNVGMIWLATVILTIGLYIPTKKFAAYKHKHKREKPWLSYL
ncbi:heparan-alpha-glucosaminide N-acetyltransferase domain-containing protein [uncultured Pseudoalteromonas sp.]|uniref:DUF1624 domain-containing protein n=1 Tax=uncultured Pseudoalteromonas sp. TaxID=114053 RepID=UPI0030C878C9